MKSLSFIILLFSIVSCREASSDFSAKERATVTKEVESMLHNYFDAIKEGGLTAEFQFLDSSDDFFWVPPGFNEALDYDSVRSILQNNAKIFMNVTFTWTELRVYPLSREIATYTGKVTGKMTNQADSVTTVRMIESGTVIKRPAGWKILCGQSRVSGVE